MMVLLSKTYSSTIVSSCVTLITTIFLHHITNLDEIIMSQLMTLPQLGNMVKFFNSEISFLFLTVIAPYNDNVSRV